MVSLGKVGISGKSARAVAMNNMAIKQRRIESINGLLNTSSSVYIDTDTKKNKFIIIKEKDMEYFSGISDGFITFTKDINESICIDTFKESNRIYEYIFELYNLKGNIKSIVNNLKIINITNLLLRDSITLKSDTKQLSNTHNDNININNLFIDSSDICESKEYDEPKKVKYIVRKKNGSVKEIV